MAEPNVVDHDPGTDLQPPFATILCAVDGSRGSKFAARQAIAICEPGVRLGFLAIANERTSGEGAHEVDLSEARARDALEEAAQEARQAGIEAAAKLLHGAPTADLLLAEAEDYELLVVGCEDIPRGAGVFLGKTATQLAHRSEGPLLVARNTSGEDSFPGTILLASEGTEESWTVARAAIALARSHQSRLRLVYVPGQMHPEHYRRVQEQMKLAEESTGTPPELIAEPGPVAEQIEKAAEATHPSLIVMGKRGLSGAKALGSVSERVMHKAASSVLIIPS
ncbi:MAG TPA: universal stress protein [Solirubrobacterales bacterium]